MGSESSNKCFITGLASKDVGFGNSNWEGYEYEIQIGETKQLFLLTKEAKFWNDNPYFKANSHLIAGLIINKNCFKGKPQVITDLSFFKELLKDNIYPITPKEKREFLFLKIFNSIEHEGENYIIDHPQKKTFEYYLRNFAELKFYLESLQQARLVILTWSMSSVMIKITFEGLNYAIKKQDDGINSKKCFIAMSFGKGVKDIREALKKVCETTNYEPVLIDEVNIDSEVTINDAIIANLKRCKFCIADYTEQKYGVYFESGFALGQGKKVIYCCREDWFNGQKGESHFDTNHFPHIIYKDIEELMTKLESRINAWI